MLDSENANESAIADDEAESFESRIRKWASRILGLLSIGFLAVGFAGCSRLSHHKAKLFLDQNEGRSPFRRTGVRKHYD